MDVMQSYEVPAPIVNTVQAGRHSSRLNVPLFSNTRSMSQFVPPSLP